MFYGDYIITKEKFILDYIGDKRHLVLPETIHGEKNNAIISYNFCSSDIVSITLPKYFADEALLYVSPKNSPPKSYPQSLRDFYVHPENEYFTAIDGVLYSRDGKELIYYPPGKTDASYRVPEGTEKIGCGAFFNNRHINEIVFPESVKEIGSCIVEMCGRLETVCFSSADIKMDEFAFFMEDIQVPLESGGYDWDYRFNENIKTVKILKDSVECIKESENITDWVKEKFGLSHVSVVFNDLSFMYQDGFYEKYSSDGKILQALTQNEKIKITLSNVNDSVHKLNGHTEYTYSALFEFIDLNFDGFPEMLVYPISEYDNGEITELSPRSFISIFDISKYKPVLIGNMYTSPASVFSCFINTETNEKILLFSDTYPCIYDSYGNPETNNIYYNMVLQTDLSEKQIKLKTVYSDLIFEIDMNTRNSFIPAGETLFSFYSDSQSNITEYVGYDSEAEYYADYNAYFSKVKPLGTVRKEITLNLVEQNNEMADILYDTVLAFLEENN